MTTAPEIAALICYHRQRDEALGLTADTSFIRGLVSYGLYRANISAAESTIDLLEASQLRVKISEAKRTIQQLIGEAQTPEQRRQILKQVVELNEQAEQAAAKLEQIAERYADG